MTRLIDRIGIQRLIPIGCAAVSAGCAIPSLIGGLPIHIWAVMVIATGHMAITTDFQDTVSALNSAATRRVNFGWLALAFSVSSSLGPVIVELAIDHIHHALAVITYAIMPFIRQRTSMMAMAAAF